jgi:CRISPR-associated protein Cas1
VDEVLSVTLSNPACTISVQALAELGRAGVVVTACGSDRTPSAVMMPLSPHGMVAARMASQANMSRPVKKKLWRQVVRGKIRNQGHVLQTLHGEDFGLMRLSTTVLSGDRTNVEATAAVRYWQAVFGDSQFIRDPEMGGRNSLLNYGYAVIRSLTARAICAHGLHPALGIQHHGRGNIMCLADDLMEPLRPLVDLTVARFGLGDDPLVELSPATKRRLVSETLRRIHVGGESRSVWDVACSQVRSVVQVIEGHSERMWVPLLEL